MSIECPLRRSRRRRRADAVSNRRRRARGRVACAWGGRRGCLESRRRPGPRPRASSALRALPLTLNFIFVCLSDYTSGLRTCGRCSHSAIYARVTSTANRKHRDP
ncbi:hypothetical protein EVAR_88502_1 [Eumeta japonica]|uniref:Uncharacterized protein n=1 Tax=Eumeta variegata TaxID=151549 RepID=A0A4C1XTR1_EUMVA|nr:hypothetical protein EVAR_88502_1 [Eumeta japonica]